jgi:hypothetical protein
MPALPDGSYQCDYPGCTAPTFPMDIGYSIPAYVAMTGDAQVPAFMCPSGQHICCSMQHCQQMLDVCYTTHLLPSAQSQAQAKGTTLIMTPPTA